MVGEVVTLILHGLSIVIHRCAHPLLISDWFYIASSAISFPHLQVIANSSLLHAEWRYNV